MPRQISEVEQIVMKAVGMLRERIPVTAAYLFGSYVLEQATDDSDIDLAVFTPALENMNIENKIDLLARVQLALGVELEIHLFHDKSLGQARPTNIYGYILSTGKKVA